jgi:NADP oxidoreductase coenzyme F420-dependent
LVRIAIVGAGRIGGNAARLWSRAGHDLVMCLSRHPDRDRSMARNTGTPRLKPSPRPYAKAHDPAHPPLLMRRRERCRPSRMRYVSCGRRHTRRGKHPDATQHGRSTMANNQPQPCPAEAAATQAIIVTHGIQRTERGHGGRLGEEVTQ